MRSFESDVILMKSREYMWCVFWKISNIYYTIKTPQYIFLTGTWLSNGNHKMKSLDVPAQNFSLFFFILTFVTNFEYSLIWNILKIISSCFYWLATRKKNRKSSDFSHFDDEWSALSDNHKIDKSNSIKMKIIAE
jgi:hypothetical protein